MKPCRHLLVGGALVATGTGVALAQMPPDGGRGRWSTEDRPGSYVRLEGGGFVDEDTVRTARETVSHSTGTPLWTNPKGFEKDVFTFARVVFKSTPGRIGGRGRGRHLGWWVDFPDADLNLSYRLQQMTSAKVDPDGRVIKLTDPALPDYPMIYMEHVGYMELTDPEVLALRSYLETGGALFVNDFWSTVEWDGFAAQMQRVLPGRNWTELTTDHPIFHAVFNLSGPMNSFQVPTINFWNRAHNPQDPNSPLQSYRGEGSENMHLRAWYDDRGRIMIIAIHNSDVSDGWEREGEDDVYFHTFSEKISYPLGINIIFYLMTH